MKHIQITFVLLFQLYIYSIFSINEVFAQELEKYLTNYSVIMTDIIAFATDVYLPEGEGLFTCILIRTPYNKNGTKGDCEWFKKYRFKVE